MKRPSHTQFRHKYCKESGEDTEKKIWKETGYTWRRSVWIQKSKKKQRVISQEFWTQMRNFVFVSQTADYFRIKKTEDYVIFQQFGLLDAIIYMKFECSRIYFQYQVSRAHIHGTFEMWYWRRLEDISQTDHLRNAEVLHRFEWGINIVQNRQEKTRNKT